MNQCKYGRLLLSCNLNLKWPQKFAILIEWHKTIQLLFNNKFLSFIDVKWTNSDLFFKSNVEQNMNYLWFSDWCLKSLSKFEMWIILYFPLYIYYSNCRLMDFYEVQSFWVVFMSWSAIICSAGKTIHSIWSCWGIMIVSQLIL